MAAVSIYTGQNLDWSFPAQVAAYVPVGIVLMVVISLYTKPEPKEKLRQFYTLLDTPVGQEQRLRELNVDIKLEGESQGKNPDDMKTSRLEKVVADGDVEDGFIIVDLLRLKEKFSWQRYRTDILGFLAVSLISLLMIVAVIFIASIGA